MGGKHSRNKGARSERQLRDELIRHGWQDVARVPLSGAVKTKAEYQDDVVGTAPDGEVYRFENKARATGFERIYALLPPSVEVICFATPTLQCLAVSLNPNAVITQQMFTKIESFDEKTQKVLKQVVKKCEDWIGNADILSLKQDRKPFIYVRYSR